MAALLPTLNNQRASMAVAAQNRTTTPQKAVPTVIQRQRQPNISRTASHAITGDISNVGHMVRQAQRSANNGLTVVATAAEATQRLSHVLRSFQQIANNAAQVDLPRAGRRQLISQAQNLKQETKQILRQAQFKDLDLSAGATNLHLGSPLPDVAHDEVALSLPDLNDTVSDAHIEQLSSAHQAQMLSGEIHSRLALLQRHQEQLSAAHERLEQTLKTVDAFNRKGEPMVGEVMDTERAVQLAEGMKIQLRNQAAYVIPAQAQVVSQAALRLLSI